MKELMNFLKKGRDVLKPYDFDLKPLIDNFSFYEFCDNARKRINTEEDHGAFVVITNKQYIVGYNSGFGTGSHSYSYARVMKDLTGGGPIKSLEQALELEEECKKEYLVGRILFEPYRD